VVTSSQLLAVLERLRLLFELLLLLCRSSEGVALVVDRSWRGSRSTGEWTDGEGDSRGVGGVDGAAAADLRACDGFIVALAGVGGVAGAAARLFTAGRRRRGDGGVPTTARGLLVGRCVANLGAKKLRIDA
jgi:hypothetical protein